MHGLSTVPLARGCLTTLVALAASGLSACGPTETSDTSDASTLDAPAQPDASTFDAPTQPDASTLDAASTPDAADSPDAPAPPDADPNDVTPPTVETTAPANEATAVALLPAITVTFSEPMNPATITTNTAGTTCTGSLQLSADAFATCVQMSAAPSSSDQTEFEITPAAPLDSATLYSLRVTTAAEDSAGNALASAFETATGFTVRYCHTVPIDGTNDFTAATEELASSTAGAQIFISHDDENLYLGLAHSDIIEGGTGNKFVYFLMSTDTSLATGNVASSDGKAIFGAAGTKRLTYHWKERIDGESYSEFRIGDGSDWSTDWTTNDKSVYRTTGLIEASIALTEFGSIPEHLVITTYTVDYAGDGGNGWLYNMLDGATDGSGLTPVNLFGYVQLDLPSSLPPNHATHLRTF